MLELIKNIKIDVPSSMSMLLMRLNIDSCAFAGLTASSAPGSSFNTQSQVVAQLTPLVAIQFYTGPAPWQLSRCTAQDD